jgi:TRAP-type mannitol/chloroaromatic compound transport system substrate-binding protein
MKKIMLVLSVLLTIVILVMTSCTPAAKQPEPIKWRMATSWTTDNLFYTKAAAAICDRVKQLSNGRLVIEPYPAGAIVDALGVMDAVSKGTVEIGHSWSGYWVDKESYFELFTSIPNQMTANEWMVWMYGPAKGIDLWTEAYAKYNIVPFPGGLVGPEFGFFTNKPVQTLEDFKGMKLRVTGLAADVARELGATTVLTAPGDIKAAMQKGEIDGFEFSCPAIDWPMGFQEVASYVCLPSWHQPSAMFETTVNKDAYNALPDDLKAILEAACKEVGIIDFLTYLEGANAEYLQKFVDYGVKINVLDTQAMAEITSITNRLADAKAVVSPFYAKVLQSQRNFKTDYRTWEKWEDYTLYP